jgi:Family of unknown function (DUF6272)
MLSPYNSHTLLPSATPSYRQTSILGGLDRLEHLLSREVMPFRKRVFSVFIEAMQNAFAHGTLSANHPSETGLWKFNDSYVIVSSNTIQVSSMATLSKNIDCLNSMDNDQLRRDYKDQLIKPVEGNSCGLGFMSMKRKSGSILQYGFEKIDTLYSYFYLRIRVQATPACA